MCRAPCSGQAGPSPFAPPTSAPATARTAPSRRRSSCRRVPSGSRPRARVMMSFENTTMSASLPDGERALLPLLERRVRVVQRVRRERLGARDALLGEEHRAVARLARVTDAVEARNRVDVLDRRVGAVGDDDAGVDQRAPQVRRAPRALLAEPRRAPTGRRTIVWIPCMDAMTPSCGSAARPPGRCAARARRATAGRACRGCRGTRARRRRAPRGSRGRRSRAC